ncbi:uncharacterized protein BO95DRAFT_446220 [Aspergillus brunneoviolaceus CBS 621.78]|uniref:Uncharacterized protein n=1 Tax=Aspergillus brunneoviolaceus CBS 621.78 TaxID=1450534 RepID=A0ACD1FZ93_9EURO|nr:hypothetical protein BO95DRAFT_446220 [Aspergillus brunneoviolaceus CBS 621.78]RAH42289.1 hypothetical protein BO95DRAFT_446220 [Aspergillus brunneoviolaceus CBS 621.78]
MILPPSGRTPPPPGVRHRITLPGSRFNPSAPAHSALVLGLLPRIGLLSLCVSTVQATDSSAQEVPPFARVN